MTDGGGRECIADVDAIETLYARHASRVRNLVRLGVSAPEAVVEDACQVAWLRLVRRYSHVRRDAAVRWLVQTARHEVLRHHERTRLEDPLAALEAEPARASAPDLLDALVVRSWSRERLGRLTERQRRLVWLHGLGLTYEEIAGTTGDSRRTVERQLMRARELVREPEAA